MAHTLLQRRKVPDGMFRTRHQFPYIRHVMRCVKKVLAQIHFRSSELLRRARQRTAHGYLCGNVHQVFRIGRRLPSEHMKRELSFQLQRKFSAEMVKLVRLAQAHETQASFPVGFRSAQFILKDTDAHGCSFIHQSHITRPSRHIHRVFQISAAPFLHAGYGHDILRCFLEPAGKFFTQAVIQFRNIRAHGKLFPFIIAHPYFRNQLRRMLVFVFFLLVWFLFFFYFIIFFFFFFFLFFFFVVICFFKNSFFVFFD